MKSKIFSILLIGILALMIFAIDVTEAQCVITINGTDFTPSLTPVYISYYGNEFPMTDLVNMDVSTCKFQISMYIYTPETQITATNTGLNYEYLNGVESGNTTCPNVDITMVKGEIFGLYQNLTLKLDVKLKDPATVVVVR
ncbi:unnamed protein product [Gordionus sp. m RMFG-2023]